MPSGILIIDKPAGWTSMDVCAKVRGIFHEKRVGHGGTLDPMATGACRSCGAGHPRGGVRRERPEGIYVAGLRLGQVTDTQDVTGTTLETRPVTADRAALDRCAPLSGRAGPRSPYVIRCQGRRAETLRPGPEGTGRLPNPAASPF